MDWNSVTVSELAQAIRETDWGTPRSAREFFDNKFGLPRDASKLVSRFKSNVFYYRANYLLISGAIYAAAFLRNPLALVALLLTAVAVLTTNDSFATSLNDSLLRIVRRIHAPTAVRLRARAHAAHPDGSLGKRGAKQRVYILHFPRWVFVAGCLLMASVLVRISCAWVTLAWATLLGLGLPLAHASLRQPNLKAKLSNAREEFRAQWRGYQMEMQGLGVGMPNFTDYSR